MRILNKYLLLMIFKRAVYSLMALVLIFSFFKFIDELNYIDKNAYEVNDALIYTLFLLPSISNSLLTISFLLGTVLTIGMLNANKEIQILLSGGISINFLIKKIIKFNLLLIVIFQISLEIISPLSYEAANSYKNVKMGIIDSNKNLGYWLKKDNRLINFDLLKDKQIYIFEVKDNILKIFTEGSISKFDNKKLTIDNALTKEINQDTEFATINANPSKKSLEIPLSDNDFVLLGENYREMSFIELTQALVNSLQNQLEHKYFFQELISRLIKPFNLLGMLLIAVPFVMKIDRMASIGRMLFVALSIGVLSSLITKILTISTNYFDNLSEVFIFMPTFILVVFGVFLSKRIIN